MLIPILIGIGLVVLIGRKLKNHVLELLFFGGLFGLAEAYRFWGVDILNFPPMPEWLLIGIASAFIFWSVMKIFMVIGRVIPGASFLGILPKITFGD